MKKQAYFFSAILMFFLCSCAATKSSSRLVPSPELLDEGTFVLSELSSDHSYGYTEKNPIKVGGSDKSEGPLNERRFLNALAGPLGEQISYERVGSCCAFKTKNGFMGQGLLDQYKIEWEGQKEPLYLYLNMYDYDTLRAPVGFTIR